MNIAIDAMGGDNAPGEIIIGAVNALNKFQDITITLTGNELLISACLNNINISYDKNRLKIANATQIIETAESPVEAVKEKKDSSLVVGLKLVVDKKSDVFITAGSTGAMLAGAMLIIRRIKGVKRPALAPVLPTLGKNGVLLIDCGANVDSKPSSLAQFAVMGSVYMKNVMGVENPRVGLLNNGAEEEKGSELTKAAYELLKTAPVNFTGNCEARDVMSGNFDVCVCDGFAGNVVLKGVEGTADMIMKKLKYSLSSNLLTKIGALLCKSAFGKLKNELDYSEYGGALLLGVNGGVIKAHGSSDSKTILSAIRQARDFILGDVVEVISSNITKLNIEND